jgi:copper homeostasis protein
MKIELCAASVEAIDLAVKYKVDRIELCQSLESGGLTPSMGLIEKAISSGMETHVLIRPRSGNFYFTPNEKEIMINDISYCKSLGVDGVVVGSLDENQNLEESFLIEVIRAAGDMDVTFHRAFDECISWRNAMDTLVALNFTRILSSGQSKTVSDGLEVLKQMVDYADNHIEIMAGGGVNVLNLNHLLNEVKVNGIHFSGTDLVQDVNSPLFGENRLRINEQKVKSLLKLISV